MKTGVSSQSRIFEREPSALGHYYVSIDGEGVGDDYVLLDSSASLPRLYTGRRLTTDECLSWVWELGKWAGFARFVLYGARYDYENWVRDFNETQLRDYAAGRVVQYGRWLVQYMAGYRFALRRLVREDVLKYERREFVTPRGVRQRSVELVCWDVAPFWQSRFADAVRATLGDDAHQLELIDAGKAARGSFTHDNIEWVSRYNLAECKNLVSMCYALDSWFAECEMDPVNYNGPGAAAKAMLRRYEPWYHGGRVIKGEKVGTYIAPGWQPHRLLEATLSAYAGGRNQILYAGHLAGTSYQYDINSAYPSACAELPCLTHGRWEHVREFEPNSFGVWRFRYASSESNSSRVFHPFFYRQSDGSIVYPASISDRWGWTPELAAGLAHHPQDVAVREGWVWRAVPCDNPYPLWWVNSLCVRRLRHKAEGERGAAQGLKLALNSIYGSLAQARGGEVLTPPQTQQLQWAGWITAVTRARLYLAACLGRTDVLHMATDGLLSRAPLPLRIGPGAGEWEETELHDLTLVQYGMYFCKEKSRYRGFVVDDVDQLVTDIREKWNTPWCSRTVTRRAFITAGLIANGQRTFQQWCHWEEQPRELSLNIGNEFEHCDIRSGNALYPVRCLDGPTTRPSALYRPKWGQGDQFKDEDVLEIAYQIAEEN